MIICSLTSLATGTFGGTVGIALMSLVSGLGIPESIFDDMVVSGGVFGDKMSPISDTTNLVELSSLNYGHTNATGVKLVDTLIVRGRIQ